MTDPKMNALCLFAIDCCIADYENLAIVSSEMRELAASEKMDAPKSAIESAIRECIKNGYVSAYRYDKASARYELVTEIIFDADLYLMATAEGADFLEHEDGRA